MAVEVMAEQGVAGLSLGEVARRMGVRPPSLYVYVASKNAVYDAVFGRGWHALHEVLQAFPDPGPDDDLPACLRSFAEVYVRWSLENPVHAQLMSWRPVPGFEPSVEAFAHALAAYARTREVLARLQELGLFRPDVDAEELMAVWTVLSTGVVTRQLANAPEEGFEQGRVTRFLPQLVDMLLAQYGPVRRTAAPRRGRHATTPGRH